jgi:hypothetical protein
MHHLGLIQPLTPPCFLWTGSLLFLTFFYWVNPLPLFSSCFPLLSVSRGTSFVPPFLYYLDMTLTNSFTLPGLFPQACATSLTPYHSATFPSLLKSVLIRSSLQLFSNDLFFVLMDGKRAFTTPSLLYPRKHLHYGLILTLIHSYNP